MRSITAFEGFETMHTAQRPPIIAPVPMRLRCVSFYCGVTGDHYAAYHLGSTGDRMYACSKCGDTQRIMRHIWEASEAQHAASASAVRPIMPIPWSTAYGYARKNGAPAIAHYIATREYLRAKSAGDAVNASRWNHRRYDSASVLLGDASTLNRALVGRA